MELSIQDAPILPIQLEKAYTFFMVPFSFDNTQNLLTQNLLWELETDKVSNEGEDGDILYSYIMDFLQGQMKGLQCDHLTIYRLKPDEQSERYRLFWKKMIDSTHVMTLKEKENGIKFKLLSGINTGFRSPHLFISQSAQIGILTFCIELAEEERTMEDLKLLNYYLHKIHEPLTDCTCHSLKMNAKMQFKNDEKSSAEEKRKQQEESLRKARSFMRTESDPDVYNDYTWNIRNLIDMWLDEMSEITLFSQTRTHLFTYCQIDDSREEKLRYEDLLPDLIRLSRCVNDKYRIDVQNEAQNGCCFRTFENIYVASSVEGTSIMAIAKKNNKGFISNMDGSIRLRYLWVYLLALIQRYSMLHLNQKLTEQEANMTDTQLQGLYNVIQKVRIHCYYTDVSPFSQHNQFYQHCSKCLHVEETYNEIERKAEILTQNISKRAQDKADAKQRQLNIVISILTIFQVGDAIYTFANREDDSDITTPIFSMVTFAIIICVIFHKNILDYLKRLFITK